MWDEGRRVGFVYSVREVFSCLVRMEEDLVLDCLF